jgi:hypothetical protein
MALSITDHLVVIGGNPNLKYNARTSRTRGCVVLNMEPLPSDTISYPYQPDFQTYEVPGHGSPLNSHQLLQAFQLDNNALPVLADRVHEGKASYLQSSLL